MTLTEAAEKFAAETYNKQSLDELDDNQRVFASQIFNAYMQGAKFEKETDGRISVEDRLPEGPFSVIIHTEYVKCVERVTIGFYIGGRWYHASGEPITVTHWQPLPNPPQSK